MRLVLLKGKRRKRNEIERRKKKQTNGRCCILHTWCFEQKQKYFSLKKNQIKLNDCGTTSMESKKQKGKQQKKRYNNFIHDSCETKPTKIENVNEKKNEKNK